MSFDAAVHAQAIELDRMALEMCAAAGSGHPSTALSLGQITTVLMFSAMRWSPDFPDYPTSDRLVLSSGHSVPIVYAAACKLGVSVAADPEKLDPSDRRKLSLADANTLRENDSPLDGHPNPVVGFPFFDAATGSLGQGLSVAAGVAEAARLDGIDKRVYCIVGDGEAREGQIAEALDHIAERGLTNVLPIFNCNEFGQADRVSHQQSPEMLAKKLEAYGFDVRTIDGHKPEAIKGAFDEFAERSTGNGAPMAVIAKTVKGWGAPSIQGGGWHGKPPSGEALQRALEELDQTGMELTTSLSNADMFEIQPPNEAPAPHGDDWETPSFSEAMRQFDMESLFQTGRLATRKAYGVALRALGKATPKVVALDADTRNSTFSEMFLKDGDLAHRFIECKIAEQNMFSLAAGLSAGGKIPFASSFSKFITRAYDQIEMAINSGANLKIVGSHSGVTLAADGPSQMSLPDVAWFRAFSTAKDHRGNPACYVLQPSDAYAAYALT
ncbi:MAG: thiamine pyrophosphate-dependent enzyme, partial [Planctomycetota bacterium]